MRGRELLIGSCPVCRIAVGVIVGSAVVVVVVVVNTVVAVGTVVVVAAAVCCGRLLVGWLWGGTLLDVKGRGARTTGVGRGGAR